MTVSSCAVQGKQPGSTGNLMATAHQESHHHHRLSHDGLMHRTSSACHDLPAQEWVSSLDGPNGTPGRVNLPFRNPLNIVAFRHAFFAAIDSNHSVTGFVSKSPLLLQHVSFACNAMA